jgi:hypothetical protein
VHRRGGGAVGVGRHAAAAQHGAGALVAVVVAVPGHVHAILLEERLQGGPKLAGHIKIPVGRPAKGTIHIQLRTLPELALGRGPWLGEGLAGVAREGCREGAGV